MHTRHRIIGLVVLALCAIIPARAQLTIEPTVSESLGTFHYSYKVNNATGTDVSIVTLSGLFAGGGAVMNLSAPDGYLADYDAGVNLLSFIEGDHAFLAGATSAAFTFDSSYGPGLGAFEAVNIEGDVLTGAVLVPATPVPEPSTTAAIGGLLLIALVLRRNLLPKSK